MDHHDLQTGRILISGRLFFLSSLGSYALTTSIRRVLNPRIERCCDNLNPSGSGEGFWTALLALQEVISVRSGFSARCQNVWVPDARMCQFMAQTVSRVIFNTAREESDTVSS